MTARPLQDKVAVVTGAGGTMGSAVVRVLVEDGCRVALVDRDAASMAPLVRHYGNRVVAVACDISDAAAVTTAGTIGRISTARIQ